MKSISKILKISFLIIIIILVILALIDLVYESKMEECVRLCVNDFGEAEEYYLKSGIKAGCKAYCYQMERYGGEDGLDDTIQKYKTE